MYFICLGAVFGSIGLIYCSSSNCFIKRDIELDDVVGNAKRSRREVFVSTPPSVNIMQACKYEDHILSSIGIFKKFRYEKIVIFFYS